MFLLLVLVSNFILLAIFAQRQMQTHDQVEVALSKLVLHDDELQKIKRQILKQQGCDLDGQAGWARTRIRVMESENEET